MSGDGGDAALLGPSTDGVLLRLGAELLLIDDGWAAVEEHLTGRDAGSVGVVMLEPGRPQRSGENEYLPRVVRTGKDGQRVNHRP